MSAIAQDHVGGYFGVGIGAAIPLGDAAEKDITKDPSYLKPGPAFGIYGSYMISKTVGIAATLNMQANSDNIDEIQSELTQIIRTNTGISNYEVVYDSDGWGVLNLMAGPTAALGNDVWIIEPFVVGGLFLVSTPDLFPELVVGSASDAGELKVQVLPGFGYQAGFNIRYNLGYQFAINFRSAYSAGSAKGKNIHSKMYLADIWSNTISVADETNDFMQDGYEYSMESLHLTVGLNFLLERKSKGNNPSSSTSGLLTF